MDAANGIGAIALKELVAVIENSLLSVKITNDDVKSKGVLNHEVLRKLDPLFKEADSFFISLSVELIMSKCTNKHRMEAPLY